MQIVLQKTELDQVLAKFKRTSLVRRYNKRARWRAFGPNFLTGL